jgi:NADH-quinone oxidoreductase subunit L
VAWLTLIPLLPAVAFAVMLPMSRPARTAVRWLPAAATAVSLVLSVLAFAAVVAHGGTAPIYSASVEIARIGGAPLAVGIKLDSVTAVMLLVVTVVATCVQIYSLFYMRSEERRGWYFAVLSLFTAAMLLLVLAGDFLLLYMSWEVMGLCSYLLIGFWHEQDAPRSASIKAFLTTRVGDVGFAIGLAAMWAYARSFDFSVVLHSGQWTAPAATVVALGLLFGAMGKSAQVPLHVWLPDAMAGPTPASALIHAATMVAAGVYLVARALPIFHAAAPWVLPLVMAIGTLTALVGALLAVVQHDIKKVLAYSTISQLGYMFIALGAGSEVAALFHLTTHAFFKSLLFLAAGAIIHATHMQDIREMGGLRRSMPWTTTVFIFGALALSGVFPFSGFWSKDDILMALVANGHWYADVALVVAVLVAGITAFYMTRVCVRVFAGEEQAHAHEGHAGMVAPMAVLAAITAVIGFTSPVFAGFLGAAGGWPDPVMATVSTLVVLAGIAGGWWVFGADRVDTGALKSRWRRVYAAFEHNFYFDDVYRRVFVDGYALAAAGLAAFDASVIDGAVNGVARAWSAVSALSWGADVRVIDGAVNGVGRLVTRAGARVRMLQTGEVQGYQRLAYAALLVLLAASVLAPFVGVPAAFAGGAVVLLLMGVLVAGGAR